MGLLTLIPSYLNVKDRHQPLPKRPLANVDESQSKTGEIGKWFSGANLGG